MSPFALAHNAVFSAIFHSSADVIVLVDADGKIALVNEAVERILGHPVDSLVGKAVEVLIPNRFKTHAHLRKQYLEQPRTRAMGGDVLLHALHADGREIPVDISLTPLEVDGRKFTVSVIRDMRGRIHRPEVLRVHATALRSAANGIVITDRRGYITWVNPAACAITGYASSELIGEHTRILKSGEHEPDFYATLWQTISRGESWSGTIVNRRKDGSHYYEEQTIAPVVDEEGTVSHFIAIKQDVTEKRRNDQALVAAHRQLEAYVAEVESLNQQLREKSIRDPLTGLHNRRFFDELADRELARARRRQEPLCAVVLDVDNFKRVNDTYGHEAGDQVLVALAGKLRAHSSVSDLVCRMGGEEFVCLLAGATLADALERAEIWRETVAGLAIPIHTGSDESIRCTISIGVADFQPMESLESLLRRADAALYEAKRSGRNRTVSSAAIEWSA